MEKKKNNIKTCVCTCANLKRKCKKKIKKLSICGEERSVIHQYVVLCVELMTNNQKVKKNYRMRVLAVEEHILSLLLVKS